MHEDLPKLIRELRNETCPQRVFDEAARRISAQAPPARRFGFGFRVAFASLVLLCCLSFWRRPDAPNTERRAESPAPATADRAEIGRQAETALAFIGSVLADAGDRSQRVIFNEAVPPLRNSFDIAKDKISNHIKL